MLDVSVSEEGSKAEEFFKNLDAKQSAKKETGCCCEMQVPTISWVIIFGHISCIFILTNLHVTIQYYLFVYY